MQFVEIAGEINISRIVFGAWAVGGWHWGGSDDGESIRAVHAALDRGINCFDTAPVYGFGRSESVLGEALRGKRDAVVATKCGLRWDNKDGKKFFETTADHSKTVVEVYRNLRASSIRKECEDSLRRLRRDWIDIYQVHWLDPTVNLEETIEELRKLKKEGKIRFVGVSNFTVQMMVDWRKISSDLQLSTDQEKFNLMERKAQTGNLQYTIKNKIAFLAYESLAQGLLTGAVDENRLFPEGDYRASKPNFQTQNRVRIQEALSSIADLREKYQCTNANIAAGWLLCQKGVTAAICGIRNESQAGETIRGGEILIEQADSERLSRLFQGLLKNEEQL